MEHPMRVLVADPRVSMRADMVSMMERLHCEIVAEAEDGPSALAAFLDTRPDLVVLGLDLPGLSGPRAACELASDGARSVMVAGSELLVVLDDALLNDDDLPVVLESLQSIAVTTH
jgi:CheY-like chemotaxis protein